MQKLLVILGQTSTGKSDLAVQLAKKFNGEVISADSRQVYIGLNIGTGKITKKEMSGIPHYMLDVVSPKKRFDVVMWHTQATKIIADIHARGKLPIVCGGTGFYIQSIVHNISLPEVPPDPQLRKRLEQKTTVQLVKILGKLDPKRLRTIDQKNPVRLIRAIEIATHLGSVPKLQKKKSLYDVTQIGLTLPDEKLKERILARILSRMKSGMVAEARKLHMQGLSWKRMHDLGLEYRYLALLLQNKISKAEFVTELNTAIWHYTRRQMQWFKRDKKILWFTLNDVIKIQKEVAKWLMS